MTKNSRHRDSETKRLRDFETKKLRNSDPKPGTRTEHRDIGASSRAGSDCGQRERVNPERGTANNESGTLNSSWYAIYTKARNEKKVHERLLEQGIESYLPLVKTLRQWSDRKKWVEVPLLSSYVFVRVPQYQLREVIQVDGAAKYISFEGKPAAIPDKQIDNLRLLVNGEADIEVTGEKLSPGDPVEVTTGSLRGLTGELIKINNKNKVVVRIDRLDINLVVKIQKAFLKKIR